MSEHQQKSWYRPDIDGLRAVAVVAVMLFHAQVPGFSGGYVGVDVFFVISGFLITSIIVRQLQQGTFSFLKFWERRIRRIVPVLTVVLLVTAAVGYWLILFPLDYLDFGQSLFAQAFFLSNVFFLRKSDYFAGPAEEAPLLHTWSLAIEEQFYVVFPVLLFVLWRFGQRVALAVLGFLLLASVGWSQYLLSQADAAFSIPFLPPIWAAADNATASFYLLPARAFELLIGVLLALIAVRITTRWLAEVAAVAGLGFILWSIVAFTEATAFPGVAALIPTLGAALLILAHTNHETVIIKVLTRPAVVWVGLLSYSLYLWHWPVLVLGKYWLGTDVLDGIQIFALLTLTLLLSVGSYYLVETPVRSWRPDAPSWRVFVAGFGALGLLAGIGYTIMGQDGLPNRAPEAARQIALGATDFGPDRTRCFVESRPCQFGPVDQPVTHVVVGDSHGGAVLPALAAVAEQSGIKLETYLSPGCSPLTPLAQQVPNSTCDRVHQAALAAITDTDVTAVLLVSRWSNYRDLATDQAKAIEQFSSHLTATVAELQRLGVSVYVLGQVPHHTYFETRTAFYAAIEADRLPDYQLSRREHDELQQPITAVFNQADQAGELTLLDPTSSFCNQSTCDLVRDSELLYQDSNHVNQTGALLLVPLLSQFVTAHALES